MYADLPGLKCPSRSKSIAIKEHATEVPPLNSLAGSVYIWLVMLLFAITPAAKTDRDIMSALTSPLHCEVIFIRTDEAGFRVRLWSAKQI